MPFGCSSKNLKSCWTQNRILNTQRVRLKKFEKRSKNVTQKLTHNCYLKLDPQLLLKSWPTNRNQNLTHKWYSKTSPQLPHLATRHRRNVVTTSLCMAQWRRRYISNEAPNDVSVEHRQDVSVVRLHNFLLKRRDNVSRGRNDDVPSVRLHDVSDEPQMKHPTTSQLYVTKTSLRYVSTTPH